MFRCMTLRSCGFGVLSLHLPGLGYSEVELVISDAAVIRHLQKFSAA